jgi:hypothetical protein
MQVCGGYFPKSDQDHDLLGQTQMRAHFPQGRAAAIEDLRAQGDHQGEELGDSLDPSPKPFLRALESLSPELVGNDRYAGLLDVRDRLLQFHERAR